MNNGFDEFKRIYTQQKQNKEELLSLIKATLQKETFIDYMKKYFTNNEFIEEINFSEFKEKLSENEYQHLHHEYHYDILWDTLAKQGFTAIDASKPSKWLSITIQMIMNDIIEPSFLATLKKNGREEIQEAIRDFNKGDDKKLLEVSRAIKRSLYGFAQLRAKKGLYQSHPLAVSWWRIYLAKEISKQTKIDKKDIYLYFQNNISNYDELVLRMISKLTVVADKNVRDGLFLYVIDKSITDVKEFKKIIEKIGIESSWRAMGNLTPNDNKDIIESLVA
ncbi:MAG TPA: hypothetical protein EYG80_05755 [Flavobacteriaceae bacterium]|nr:hypothetical protein [Flavobacteriaceae bacterium]